MSDNKNPPKPAPPTRPKPQGLINQTGNRPGGTVTGSYKPLTEDRTRKK